VTRNQFAAFVEATNRNMSGGCALRIERGIWQRDTRINWRRPGFSQTALHPVVCVSWRDAAAFAAWLSRQTGHTYRLPSEAEWEYAARGGRTTPFAWGPSFEPALANCAACGSRWDSRATAPVGSFDANRFGLHDVHGNVAEWTWDCWSPDIAGGPGDGAPILTGHCEKRVVRGGHWGDPPENLRLDMRRSYLTDHRYVRLGFRLVRELD
jgi:formylglycine-generating enzyme required for sulfatase activity